MSTEGESSEFGSAKSSFRASKDSNDQVTLLTKLIESTKKDIMTDVYTIQKDIDHLKSSKLDSIEYYEFKNQTQNFVTSLTSGQLSHKIGGTNQESMQKSIKSLENYIQKEIKNLKNAFQIDLDTLECQLHSKIDIKDSKYEVFQMVSEKLDRKDFEKLKSSLVDISKFEKLEEKLHELENNESIYRQLDQKAEIDHVNKALTEIHDEIDESFKSFENINEALCAEN